MRKQDYLRRLSQKIIEAQRNTIAFKIEYTLVAGGIWTVFKKISPLLLTPKRKKILQLLSLTMVSSEILVQSGHVKKLRTAQDYLRDLYQARYVDFQRYIHKGQNYQHFYFITDSGLRALGLTKHKYHEIKPGLVEHDTITAIYLSHLLRICEQKNKSLKWKEPFKIETKISDGGVTIFNTEGEIIYFMLLEADNKTHVLKDEIKEKIKEYTEFLVENPKRRIAFLIKGEKRTRNIENLTHEVLKEEGQEKFFPRFFFWQPLAFSPDMDFFPTNARTSAESTQGQTQSITSAGTNAKLPTQSQTQKQSKKILAFVPVSRRSSNAKNAKK